MTQRVSASTQNQAFNALLFFFRHALGREFGKIDGVVRAKRTRYIPVVLSRAEIDAILALLAPPYDLIVKLLYGCGLRISECLELRVQCFNLDEGVLTIHDGKGGEPSGSETGCPSRGERQQWSTAERQRPHRSASAEHSSRDSSAF